MKRKAKQGNCLHSVQGPNSSYEKMIKLYFDGDLSKAQFWSPESDPGKIHLVVHEDYINGEANYKRFRKFQSRADL